MSSPTQVDGPLLFCGARPRVCATPRSKTQMREALCAVAQTPKWTAVAAEEDQRCTRPGVLVDWSEKFFTRANGGAKSAIAPGQSGVAGAALANSMLAPFLRPVHGTKSQSARPIVGVGSVDARRFVPRAKDVTHNYRSASGQRLSEAEAHIVLRVLVEEDIVLPALPQAMRASEAVSRGTMDWLVERLARTLRFSRPPRARPGFFMIVSGAHDVPLVLVQEAPGAPEPTPVSLPEAVATSWRVRHLHDNVWEAPGLAHQIGEADLQHFFFIESLRNPALGLSPDAFWIVTKDGDAAFNATLYALLHAPPEPLRIYVPQRSQKCKSYTEAPSVVARALVELYHGDVQTALSLLISIFAGGNDFVPSLNMCVPRTFADAFNRAPRRLVSLRLEEGAVPEGRNRLVHDVVKGEHGQPHSAFAHVSVVLAGGRRARLSFDLLELSNFLHRPKINADYVPERLRILIAFFVFSAQIGLPRLVELDWGQAPGVRYGFWPGPDGKLHWDFRPRAARQSPQ